MLEEFARRTREALASSDTFLGLVTPNWLADPTCWAQLGLAVALDKPIYLLVKEGTVINENFRRLAKRIEFFRADEDLALAARRLLLEDD